MPSYVGNKIAVFVLQAMGCDVAALNTVQFSQSPEMRIIRKRGQLVNIHAGNHTGYKQWKGTKSTAQEISDLYIGLKESYLDDFDMMLSGYIPGAEAVNAVGSIAAELREKYRSSPGRFFWVLDPVMGDNGRLYVAEDVVPAYKKLVSHADLILPNQFEAEYVIGQHASPARGPVMLTMIPRQLSGVKITDLQSLIQAIQVLHDSYHIPHIVITSVNLSAPDAHLSVVGSTMTSAGKARLFKIVFPTIDGYFVGTGDMFAALMVVRLREAAVTAGVSGNASWLSGDDVATLDLPLAKAARKVLASMHEVLTKTAEGMPRVVERTEREIGKGEEGDEKRAHLVKSKASELALVRNLGCLQAPEVSFEALIIE